MAKYDIEDDQGRQLQIEVDGDLTPEIAEQAFSNYDAMSVASAGPRGSEARRRAQASVSARNAQQTAADISGGSEAGPVLSGLASLGQNLVEFGTKAIAGTARADQILTDAVGNAIRDPLGDILGKNRTEAADAAALQRSDQNPLVQFGTGLTDIAKTYLPVNPKETFANLAGSAVGSVGGTILFGPLAVPAYAASSFESGIENARDAGATPTQAINQGIVEGLAGGLTERAVGLVPGLHEAGAGAMRGFARPVAKVIAGETLQEPLEGVTGRASAKYLTGSDPTANPLDVEAALMEAAGGFIGGGFGGSVAAGINARNRGQRLQAIQEYRSPEATFLRQIENAPLGRPATSAPVGAVNVPDKASIDLSPLNLPQSETAAQLPPLDPAQLDGMSSADILGVLQQRLDARRALFADRIARKSATERRANLEAGLTIPQIQPIEARPEPVIGTYPEGGMGTGVILPAEEAARRAQVRQEVSARGQQRAAEGAAENLRQQEEQIWRQLNAEQAANEMAAGQPQLPTQPAVQPTRVDMRVPAILATLNQRRQESEIWRQLHAELAANPISTPIIEARSNETRQNQVAPASPVPDVQSQPAVTQTEGQAPQGTPLQASANPQVAPRTAPQLAQQPATQPAKPRQFQGREVIGDILDDIESQGGLVSKTEARKRKLLAPDKNGPEYDDAPTLKQPLHNFIYGNGRGGKGSMTPDRMAKALEMQHPEKYAGLTVSDLWAAIESSSNSRVVTETKMRRMRDADMAEGKTEVKQQKAFDKATSKSKGGKEEVNVSDLVVGGEVTIGGEAFKVADVDPENGDVILQDGAKFGRRVVEAGKVIYVENVTQPAADVSFNEPDSFSAPPEPTGVRLRKSPLRSEPAAAQSIATSGVGAGVSPAPSPAIEGSVFGVRPYRGAPTITKEVYNRINEAIDAGIAKEDPVAQNIRDLDAQAETDIKKSSGYEPLSDGGKFDAIQRYRNKLYQSAVKWADTGKFLFDPMVIAKGVTMDVGKSGTEKMAKQTAGEETVGESGTSTTLTRATTQVLPQTAIEADTTRVRQDAVEVLNQLRARLNLSASELVSIISAYQSDTTADLNDKELAAFNAVKPTLDKIGAVNFSVSSLIAEPIGQARAQAAVDQWMDSVGNPPILIRVVDDPNLKTKNGRNVSAQIEFSQGGQPIITINGAQIGSEAEVREKIWHELLHTVWEDPSVQKAWAEVVAKITEADVQAQRARGYSPQETTMEAAIDKASVRAANTEIRPTWQRFLDSIWQALKKAFGFQSKPANFEALMISALRAAAGPWNGQQQSRYNQDVAAMDKPYMEAVSRGDMAAAQQMVDAAAKAAGYNVEGWHATANQFNQFDPEKSATWGEFWFSPAPNSGEMGADKGRNFKAFINPGRIGSGVEFLRDRRAKIIDENGQGFRGEAARNAVSDFQYDTVVLNSFSGAGSKSGSALVVFSPEQIKSADPVTYDNAGNVVLLSQRFNPESKDIRYSVANNLYVTNPERFKRIAEQGQTEAVVAQGQTASAIIPESTLKEIADLEAKPNPTPAEKAAIIQLKAVRNIVGVAVVADQIRQVNEGNWPNYRTLDDLPEQYKSVAAQSVMATHLYLNQRYNALKVRQERAATQIADITSKLDGLNESRLLALVSNNEADQLLKDLQTMIDLEIGKVGTSAASRTLIELHNASAAVVGLRQKQDAIAAALRSVAKDAPMADFASPEAMKLWIESRQADKSKPPLMTDEVATAIRASLKPGSGLPDRLSLIRALMADTAVAKAQIKDLKAKVGNPKTALKTIIALKMDANSVLNQAAKLDRSLDQQLVQLDGLGAAIGVMDRMQESNQYQARVTSAFQYGGFKYSGIIRYTNKPNGDQTLVGPSGKEYVVNFTPDFAVEKKNLDTIGEWMAETTNAINNVGDPNYITDPAKRTSYNNMLAFVSRYMTERRWLSESAWENSLGVNIISTPLMLLEKVGVLKAVLGDHLDTRFNAYRAMAGRAGSELVKRSRSIDTFGSKAKALTDSMKEPLAVARRKALDSHGLNPDDAADLAVWNRKINSWILSQNQNPGSTPVKVGDSLGEGITATKEDLAFAEMQHKFSKAVGEIYSGADVEGGVKDPEAPGISPEEQLFGLDFSRKAMQYGYAVGRQFSEAGQEHTREWMAARAKDLAEYKSRVSRAAEGEEVPMVWTERSKVAEADIEGHVYSHIRESSTDYTSTADKQSREAYREIAKSIRRGTHYSTLNDIAEALAPLLSTETDEGTVEVGASQAKESLMKALDRDVLNYNRVAELVTQPSNDPTVSDLPKALAAVRSAKGALVKARGKMSAPSYFYDYSLDTDAKRAGVIQMGKQALAISEINAARNMLSAMRSKLAEYDTKIEVRAQELGRNGKKVGTWAATRELEAKLRKQFKAGELQVTYSMLKKMADKLETLSKDREDALGRQRVLEEEAFKVAMLNFTKGAVSSVLLSMPAPIINNMTAVVLDPLRAGLMHGNIGFAAVLYGKQLGSSIKYVFQRVIYKTAKKLGLFMPRRVQDAIAELSFNLFSDMLARRQELEDSGILDAAESFSDIWSRYKANPLSFGDTTRAKETAASRAISGIMTSPVLGRGLVPATFEYIRQRFPGSGDRMVNQMNSMIETELSNRVKSKLWLWVNSLEGSTLSEKIQSAYSASIKASDIGMSEENLSNYRTTYESTGSLERLAADYYQRNPDGAKGDLLTKAQRETVVFELISLTNKEVDSTRAEITKGGSGVAGVARSSLYLFQRYALQLLGAQKRTFGKKAGGGWEKEFGQAMAYLFMIAMTLFTGASVLPLKQAARVVLQREPLTSPTLAQVAESPELVGKYLTAAAGGVMPLGASLIGAAFSGQPLMGPISANVLDNNPLVGAANNMIGAIRNVYESGDLVYPALDFARKQLWFTQPIVNTLMPGDAASREAKRAVRTGAVGMEVRESGGAPSQVKATPMTPIVRDAVAAIYENDDAKFQAAKQRGIDYLVGKGLSAKEAEKRFTASISGRDPFRSVLGTNPTEEQVSTIIGRSSPRQAATLQRAREGFSLRKKSKSKGLKLRSSSSGGRKASGLRRARKPARLRKSSLG